MSKSVLERENKHRHLQLHEFISNLNFLVAPKEDIYLLFKLLSIKVHPETILYDT